MSLKHIHPWMCFETHPCGGCVLKHIHAVDVLLNTSCGCVLKHIHHVGAFFKNHPRVFFKTHPRIFPWIAGRLAFTYRDAGHSILDIPWGVLNTMCQTDDATTNEQHIAS